MPGPPDRVVLDTNIVLALWLFSDPHLTQLRLEVEHGRLLWVASRSMMEEIHRAIKPGRCARYGTTPDQVRRRLARVPMGLLLAEPIDVGRRPSALRCSDTDDQVFINAAVDLRAAWLISRDRAVLKVARPAREMGLIVCTPQHWLAAQELDRASEWKSRDQKGQGRPKPPSFALRRSEPPEQAVPSSG